MQLCIIWIRSFMCRCVTPRAFLTIYEYGSSIFEIHRQCSAYNPSREAFVNVCSLTVAVLEFPAVGYRNNDASGTLNNAGTNGNYWSSVQNNTDNAYRLNFNSSSMDTSNGNKTNGRSVRCVRQRIYNPDLLPHHFRFIDIKGNTGNSPVRHVVNVCYKVSRCRSS